MLFRYCCPLKSLNVLRIIAKKYTVTQDQNNFQSEPLILKVADFRQNYLEKD